jgi:hypothetical protein
MARRTTLPLPRIPGRPDSPGNRTLGTRRPGNRAPPTGKGKGNGKGGHRPRRLRANLTDDHELHHEPRLDFSPAISRDPAASRSSLPSAPERIRTSDLRFRRPTLYPAELRAQGQRSMVAASGEGGIRTRDGAFRPILAYYRRRLSPTPPRHEIAANLPLLRPSLQAVSSTWPRPLLPSVLPCERGGSPAGGRRSARGRSSA